MRSSSSAKATGQEHDEGNHKDQSDQASANGGATKKETAAAE